MPPTAQFVASLDQQSGTDFYVVQSPTAGVALNDVDTDLVSKCPAMATDGNERWVVAGIGGVGGAVSIDDAVTFTAIADLAGLAITGVVWDGVRFVAVSPSRAYWSFDGIDWTAGPAGAVNRNGGVDAAVGLAYLNGVYVTMVNASGWVHYATDLTAALWTRGQQIPSLVAESPYHFGTSDSLMVLSSNTQEDAYWATDPTDVSGWTACTFGGSPFGGGAQDVFMHCPTWNGTTWLSGGARISGGTGEMGYHTSPDGKAWTRHTDAAGLNMRMSACVWDGSDFWLTGWDSAGSDDRAIFQFDGATWSRTDFTSLQGANSPGQTGIAAYPVPFLTSGVFGSVFADPARNGTGTGPLTGVTVELWQDTDHSGTYETLIGSSVTDADGVWFFAGLEQTGGDYQARLTAPAGYTATQTIGFEFTTAAGVDSHDFYVQPVDLGLSDEVGLSPFGPVYAELGVHDEVGLAANAVISAPLGLSDEVGLDPRALHPPRITEAVAVPFSGIVQIPLAEVAVDGDLIVVQTFTTLTPVPTSVVVNGTRRTMLSFESGGLGITVPWRGWVIAAEPGDQYVQISWSGLVGEGVAMAWLVHGERLVGPYTPEVSTSFGDDVPTTPEIDAASDGVVLAVLATRSPPLTSGDVPAGWTEDNGYFGVGIAVQGVRRFCSEGTVPPAEWEDPQSSWDVVAQTFYGIYQAVGSARGFVPATGIVRQSPNPPTPVSPTAGKADEDGWPAPPDPTPIVVPTTAHRDGRYPT